MNAYEWAGLMLLGLAAVVVLVALSAAIAVGIALGEVATQVLQVLP